MRILLVMACWQTIPPIGHGAVEKIIWETKLDLEKRGHQVTILNRHRKRTLAGLLIKPWTYDFVHLHQDDAAPVWTKLQRWFGFPLAISTHFGYAPFPEMWHESYRQVAKCLIRAPNLILQSEELAKVFAAQGFNGKTYVLSNGLSAHNIEFRAHSLKQALCLGRIQVRKKQTQLAQLLNDTDVECDFIGPPEDESFVVNGRNTNYLGEWTRKQIEHNLTDYSCHVLLSDGETMTPIVVLEALAAGLSLVVSPEASHNLDVNLPWIYVVDMDKDDISSIIRTAINENHLYRYSIRQYCLNTFDYDVLMPRYLDIVSDIISQKNSKISCRSLFKRGRK